MSGEFNKAEFKKLLRLGIGLRTQKEFASQTGIAAPTINKMINNDDIPCPKKSTLEVFAQNMSKVSLKELLEACGYEYDTIEDTVETFENDIYNIIKDDINSRCVYTKHGDLMSKIKNSSEKVQGVKINVDKHEDDLVCDIADGNFEVVIHWEYDGYACATRFLIACMITQSNKYIPCATNLKESAEKKHTSYKKIQKGTDGLTAEERLLQIIFGRENNNYVLSTYIGYGFYITDETIVPEGFLEFLNSHATTFCYTKENSKMFQKCFEKDADFYEIFKDFQDDGGAKGPYAVISKIMNLETEDIREEGSSEFMFWEKDEGYKEEEAKACIMSRYNNDIIEHLDNKIIFYLHTCAKELKIPEFGTIYYPTSIYKNTQTFKTEKIYFS